MSHFGETAMRMGLVSRAQLDEAYEIQRRLHAAGIVRPLAAILVGKKFLDRAQAGRVAGEAPNPRDCLATTAPLRKVVRDDTTALRVG